MNTETEEIDQRLFHLERDDGYGRTDIFIAGRKSSEHVQLVIRIHDDIILHALSPAMAEALARVLGEEAEAVRRAHDQPPPF